jgi:CHAT domain-containing protein/tetratricopeptide (TPR) repeat protein
MSTMYIHSWCLRAICLLLTILLLPFSRPLNAQSPPSNTPVQTVRRFYATFHTSAVLNCLSPKSALYAEMKEMLSRKEGAARYNSPQIIIVQIHGKTAMVRAIATTRAPPEDMLLQEEGLLNTPVRTHDRFQLVLEGTEWKISEISDPAHPFIERLLAAPTRLQRDALYREEKEFIRDAWPKLLDTFLILSNFQAVRKKQPLNMDTLNKTWTTFGLEAGEAIQDDGFLANRYRERSGLAMAEGRNLDAIADAEHSRQLAEKAHSRAGVIAALQQSGNVLTATGREEPAIEALKQALERSQNAKYIHLEAAVLMALAESLSHFSRYEEAFTASERALAIARRRSDPVGEASALHNQGLALQEMGRYADALLHYEQAARQMPRIQKQFPEDFPEVQVVLSTSIGNIYALTGRFTDALRTYRSVEPMAQDLDDVVWKIQLGNFIGLMLGKLHHYSEAEKTLQTALEEAKRDKSVDLETEIYNSLGLMAEHTGKFDEALIAFEASLKLSRASEKKIQVAGTLINIGAVHRLRGDVPQQLKYFTEGRDLAHSINFTEFELKGTIGLGDTLADRRQWADAQSTYQRAIELTEALRYQTKESTLQISLFSSYVQAYGGLMECQLEQNHEEDAFQTSEQMKARTLVELMGHNNVSFRSGMTAEERAQEQTLQGEVVKLTALVRRTAEVSSPPNDPQNPLNRLENARGKLDEFERSLFLTHPELQTQRARFAPITLQALNRVLFRNHPDLCLLSYVMGEQETALFVLTCGDKPDGPAHLSVCRLPIKGDDLAQKISIYRLRCATSDGRARGDLIQRSTLITPQNALDPARETRDANELYRILVEPAEQALQGKNQLVISGENLLSSLPFQALIDKNGKRLVERFPISYAPSVTALEKMLTVAERMDAQPRSPSILAVGRPITPPSLPDLPETEGEVREIGALFPVGQATILNGKEATRKHVLENLGSVRYLHFATHGLLNEDAPMYSAVALTASGDTDDGLLEAWQIAQIPLSARLTVLSACETALGQDTSGEGILGLTWGVFAAGCPSAVVTQWSVADKSTRLLMVEFYRQLRASGTSLSIAEALRRAQLSLMHDGIHAHPYYWAPFILEGSF